MNFSQEYVFLVILILAGFGLLIFLVMKKLHQPQDTSQHQILTEWLKTTQADIKSLQQHLTQSLQQTDKNLTDTLQKSYQELNQRLDNAAKVIGELKEETGKFSEIGRSMKDLQTFLQSPKVRGNLGEQVLQDLLAQMLPKQAFSMQYRFSEGTIVDAVIKTQAGMICIDSKFPLENYVKMTEAEADVDRKIFQKTFGSDVKKHIKDIHTKYIHQNQGTVDFALMYVPSEAIYYEIMTNNPLVYDEALSSRVLPVSPSTFYAFLQTVLISFESQRMAQEAQSILTSIRDIQKSAGAFNGKLNTLNRHVTNAYQNMQTVQTDFGNLNQKIIATRKINMEHQEPTPQLDQDHT